MTDTANGQWSVGHSDVTMLNDVIMQDDVTMNDYVTNANVSQAG